MPDLKSLSSPPPSCEHVLPPPPGKFLKRSKSMQSEAILSSSYFYRNKSNFSSTPPPPGTTSVTTRWKSPHFKTLNDWLPPQPPSNSHVHYPLIISKLKVRSCDISRSKTAKSQNRVPMRSRLHFPTNFHLMVNWYSYSIKWPPSSSYY